MELKWPLRTQTGNMRSHQPPTNTEFRDTGGEALKGVYHLLWPSPVGTALKEEWEKEKKSRNKKDKNMNHGTISPFSSWDRLTRTVFRRVKKSRC